MNQFLEENVIISEIQSKYDGGFQKFTLKTDKGSFYFKDKKSDGTPSVAFQQLQKFGFKSGDAIRVSYTEFGQNQYTGSPFRYVSKFVTVDNNTPVMHNPNTGVHYINNGNNSSQGVTPVPRWNAPINTNNDRYENIPVVQPNQDRIMELTMRIQALEQTVKKLEQTVSGHGTLLVDLKGETAVDFHTSFPREHVTDEEPVSFPGDSKKGMSIDEVITYFDPNN